jgi:hypothetical protein
MFRNNICSDYFCAARPCSFQFVYSGANNGLTEERVRLQGNAVKVTSVQRVHQYCSLHSLPSSLFNIRLLPLLLALVLHSALRRAVQRLVDTQSWPISRYCPGIRQARFSADSSSSALYYRRRSKPIHLTVCSV